MLETKRRYGAASLATSPLAAALCTAVVCLTLWHLLSCPQPMEPHVIAPTFLLILPGNASSLPPPYQTSKLPPWDRNTLIDVANFEFHFNNFPCNDSSAPPLLLVLVHSAPGNTEKRKTIRQTWGRNVYRDSSLRVLFLVGEVESVETQDSLEEENRVYRDMVQGSFKDAYRNMTYKHVMALKWTTYYCPGARYLLKTDDDVFVNSPALLDFLSQELSPWGARRLILCAPFHMATVRRSYRSKWRVSPQEYPGRIYPTYCAGWAVLYSPDVVFLLYKEAQQEKYFWIDDVHITGTLAKRANLTQTPLGALVLSQSQVESLVGEDSLVEGRNENVSTQVGVFLFGAPNLSQATIHRLWQVVLQRRQGQRVQTPGAS